MLGLYEVEHIDDPCYVMLAVNPKEYFEYFKSDNVNKKHKGIKRDLQGGTMKTMLRGLSLSLTLILTRSPSQIARMSCKYLLKTVR